MATIATSRRAGIVGRIGRDFAALALALSVAGCGGGGGGDAVVSYDGVWGGSTSHAGHSLSLTVKDMAIVGGGIEYATAGSGCSTDGAIVVDAADGTPIDGNQFKLSVAPSGPQQVTVVATGTFASATSVSGTFTVSDSCGTVSGTWAAAPGNAPPRAHAGAEQTVARGSVVSLSGSATDVNNDRLTYRWTLVSKPAGSNASLSGANTATPTFTADLAGSYVASLVVDDGRLSSAAAAVTVTATAAATSTRLYLNYGSTCAAYSPDENLLCTAFNELGGSTSRFISSTSAVEFKTTLTGPMVGSGYGVNIRLVSNGSSYQARVRILLRRAGVETILFEPPLENVVTTHNFVATGPGIIAAGQAGDELIVRTSCGGGQCGVIFGVPYQVAVSVNVSAPSYIEVPPTTVP